MLCVTPVDIAVRARSDRADRDGCDEWRDERRSVARLFDGNHAAVDRNDADTVPHCRMRSSRRPAAIADPHPAAGLADRHVDQYDLADQARRPVVQLGVAARHGKVPIPAPPDQHRDDAPDGEGRDLGGQRQIRRYQHDRADDRCGRRQKDREHARDQQFRNAERQRSDEPRAAGPADRVERHACGNSNGPRFGSGLAVFADAAQRADQLRRFHREQDRLGVGAGRELADRLDIFLRDEIVDRLRPALLDRLRHDARRFRLGLRCPFARFGIAIGRLTPSLGFEDPRLLLAFCPQDFRSARALGLQDVGALLALGLHLPAHGGDDIGRRADVLDLDAGDLDPPGHRRMIDHRQQSRVDLVALRQRFIEVHRPHHGAQVGRRQLQQRGIEVRNLIGRLGRVEHLEEDDAVGRDDRIVLGDDLLTRNVDHLLHHVHLAPHAIKEGGVEVEARARRGRVSAEMFDRILIALANDLDARHQRFCCTAVTWPATYSPPARTWHLGYPARSHLRRRIARTGRVGHPAEHRGYAHAADARHRAQHPDPFVRHGHGN
ncbi:hypothetical protein WR25_24882 [Diploscapter pachys]|uniref:Uncharacterized protein n=1 Tax=Diploscapter pachys TaxID=2018661 RepID=A0A2A2JWZ5_9BILA|nr:hypothetical protein WR25_24882 [Diploscapter pachys]